LRDLERFVRRHHAVLVEQLGLELRRPPSDSAFRYFFLQVDVVALCAAIRDWTIAQIPGGAADIDQLVCDGKTLRGSIDQTASGAARFIAQVSLYSNTLGVAIAQNTYATDAGGEIAALRQLLDRVELNGLLVQADALHANRPFSSTSSSVTPTS
jgi:hypothetical protein